jgi:hypothetical protein
MVTTTSVFGGNVQTSGSKAPLLHEILIKVNNAKDKAKKVEVLRANDSQPLRQVLKGAFDPKIEWELPEGVPPYKENEAPAGTEHTTLYQEARRLHYFIKGANTLAKSKREMMFIQLLEGLHADDASLLINVKEKKLNQVYKGLTEAVVKEAFGWNDNFTRN